MIHSALKPIYLKDYKVPPFLIKSVDLTFDLGEDVTHVKSCLEIYANPDNTKLEKNIIFQGEELELKSLLLNGKPLSEAQYKLDSQTLTICNVPETFTLEIETIIKPQLNTALTGLYKSNGIFCTQCEAEGFRRITYFLDRPDVMTSYTTTIIADEKKYPILLSNGNLIEKGKLKSNRHWVKWQDPFKKPCYLFALVAGKLDLLEDFFITASGKKVKLQIYVEEGNRDKCFHAMEGLKKAMKWDEETFGREYDLDIYMIVAVSDFNMGAMENKGLNIFNTKYILADLKTATDQDHVHVEGVVAHEYFHNWTGNRITCRDWFQLSLKEGLTVFRDQSFTGDTTSKTVSRIQDVNVLRTVQFQEDASPLAHPVRPESYIQINNFYTATIYEKGAEVIRMIRTILGKELFRKGMDLYFTRHDGEAVTVEEFVKAMEDASGIDLKQFRLWYSQSGTPILEFTEKYDENKKRYSLSVKQTIPDTPGQKNKKPMHIPIKIGLLDKKGKELKHELLNLKNAEETFQFENIASKPVLSLLREFSAPVKMHYDYSDHDLQLLFKHDSDLFNRWDAGQIFAVKNILRLIGDYQKNHKLILTDDFIDGFIYALQTVEDFLLLAEMITLPSEKYLAEQMQVVDVDAIHAVRQFVLFELAKQLKNLFLSIYQKNDKKTSDKFTMKEMGQRQIKNACLFYLMELQDPEINENIGMSQFVKSLNSNMTDTIGALRCLVNVEGELRRKALHDFYEKWKNEPLVVDKWFALQATSKLQGTLSEVKNLTNHPAFDIKNPNKVYSLIGAFCSQNPVCFHVRTGEGYEFLTNIILQLDAINPQIAARMVVPLINWRRFDLERQSLMKRNLETILTHKKLSTDVYELVSKSMHN